MTISRCSLALSANRADARRGIHRRVERRVLGCQHAQPVLEPFAIGICRRREGQLDECGGGAGRFHLWGYLTSREFLEPVERPRRTNSRTPLSQRLAVNLPHHLPTQRRDAAACKRLVPTRFVVFENVPTTTSCVSSTSLFTTVELHSSIGRSVGEVGHSPTPEFSANDSLAFLRVVTQLPGGVSDPPRRSSSQRASAHSSDLLLAFCGAPAEEARAAANPCWTATTIRSERARWRTGVSPLLEDNIAELNQRGDSGTDRTGLW
jgi:hypothetical protein